MRKLAPIALILALAGFSFPPAHAAAPPPTPPAKPASAPAPRDPFTQDLLNRLDSADPAQRAAAQKQLAAIAGFWRQPELLKQMSDATADPELKAAIQQRLDDLKARQIEYDLAHLPPISLSVTNATLPQLTAALNAALNTDTKILTGGRGGAGGGGRAATGATAATFTLDVKDKPFWEVFAALAQQQPLTYTSTTTGVRLQGAAGGGASIRRYAIDGPALAYVGAINYSRSAALQTPNGNQPVQSALSAAVTMSVDPRLHVVRYRGLFVLSATDDAGNNLARPNATPPQNYIAAQSNQRTQTLSLVPPANLGKTLALACDARIVAQISDFIPDLQNNIDKPLTIGKRTFRITRFTAPVPATAPTTAPAPPPNPAPGNIAFQLTVTIPTGEQPVAIAYALTDSAGRSLWTATTTGNTTANVAAAGSTGPYKLEIRAPEKTVEIPVHFEFKDIPLP